MKVRELPTEYEARKGSLYCLRRAVYNHEMRKKIFIDTDIGDDVDDALAIAFALRSPEVELVAVSTVYGDVLTRARLARKVVIAFGGEIPVAPGASNPLAGDLTPPQPNQAVVLTKENEMDFEEKGSRLLIEYALRDEGLTVCTIGAQTNVALAMIEQPEILSSIRVVMMGGAYNMNRAEYNITCDPEASARVFSSGVEIIALGLDVTTKCRLREEELERIRRSERPEVKLLRELIEAWQRAGNTLPTLHDPLAIAVSFRPELVRLEKRHVEVECAGTHTRGYTVCRAEENSRVSVAVEVDREGFVELFLSRILCEGS